MTRINPILALGVAAVATISPAHSADSILPGSPGVVDVSGRWDGVHVGAFAGYGWGTVFDDDASLALTNDTLDLAGWMAGVEAGASFSLSNGIVVGVVGDVAWSGIGGEQAGTLLFDVNWIGSARGRLGYDGGMFLPYLTAGAAFAGTRANDGSGDKAAHLGWTVGAGVEFAVTDDLSVDVHYRYSDYGPADYALTAPEELELITQTVQMGLVWRF